MLSPDLVLFFKPPRRFRPISLSLEFRGQSHDVYEGKRPTTNRFRSSFDKKKKKIEHRKGPNRADTRSPNNNYGNVIRPSAEITKCVCAPVAVIPRRTSLFTRFSVITSRVASRTVRTQTRSMCVTRQNG